MTLTRAITLGERARADSGDLLVDMAFASQTPVERFFGMEVLEVSEAAVRLGRLNDGASVLFNHNADDLRGTHVRGSVRAEADGVLRGRVRITSATERGRETIALIEGDVLTKASIGYQIHRVVEQIKGKGGRVAEREIDGATFERLIDTHRTRRDGAAFRRDLDSAVGRFDRADGDVPVYRVVDWEPTENSLVTQPADASVGIGRSFSHPAAMAAPHEGATMADQQAAAGVSAEDQSQQQAASATRSLPAQGAQQGNRAVELEQSRRRGIENLCRANKIDDNIRDHWIGTGLSVEAITDDLLTILEQRGIKNPQSDAKLGLGDGETKRYSLMKAIRAVADKNWTDAGFELECSREIAKRLNTVTDPNKFFVPFEVQQRSLPGRRDLTVGTTTAGGFLVGTENMSFIDQLRNRSVAYRMGARRLAGLQGNVTIPRQSASATAYWLSTEATSITESQQTFGQLSLSPKTVGAYTEISRQLMLQSSPDAEGIVTGDLSAVAALALDAGVLNGSGSAGQPTGITATAGIGAVTGTSLAYAGILEFQTDVATANVMPAAGGYVTTPAVAALMMQRVKFASTASPLWEGNVWDGSMAGFAAMSSNQMAAATMLYGDWQQVVVAEWGVLQIEVNPYANFQAGIIGVRAIVSVDVGLRYAAAFSLASSIT